MKVQVSFLFERYQEHLAEILLNVFSSKSLCDVRLIGEDEIPVMAHRVILAAFSSVFNAVMQNNTVQTLNIKVRGMDYQDIQTIIQFMYQGEASVAHSGVDKFLRAAKFLGVSQLSDQCKAAAAELSREFSIECVDSNEVDEEKIMEEAPDYLRSTNADLDTQYTRDSDLEAMEGENPDEYGIRIEEDNLKIEVNDDRMVDEESFASNVMAKDCNEVTIGEPALDFNIFSSVLYSHNFFRKVHEKDGCFKVHEKDGCFKVHGKDGCFKAFCLMCWKRDRTTTLLRIPDSNIKGLRGHMAYKHAEYVDNFVSQHQKVEIMRKERREEMKQQQGRDSVEQSRIRFERKRRREQDIYDIKMKKIDKKQEDKKVLLIHRKENEKIRAEKRIQCQEAQAKMLQIVKKVPLKPTAAQEEEDNDMAEKVLEEEFTIGEPSDLNFSIFSSVLYSHNFYRKSHNGPRALCLMCLRSKERKKVFIKITDSNIKGVLVHMNSQHLEHTKKFNLQNDIIKRLRNVKREERLYKKRSLSLS